MVRNNIFIHKLENFVDIINEGETITIRNCKVPVVNGYMRMVVDAFGKIERSKVIYNLLYIIYFYRM
jgi:hypothetical protein